MGEFSLLHFAQEVMTRWILLLLLLGTTRALEEVASPAYLALSAEEKADRLWSNCLDDSTSAPWFSSLDQGLKLLTEPMCPVFRTGGDELPEQGDGTTRAKVIHTVGAVGRVEWRDVGGHNYSGIFKGAKHGLARLSLALEPDTEKLNTAPGMGLKFLRDGMDSANLVAMYSVNGQEGWNFFQNDFTTHLGPAGLELIPVALKFSEATNYVQEVGLSDWGLYGADGVQVDAADWKFPFMLRFKPTGEISFPDEYVNDWKDDLMSIPVGTTLYQIWALDEPEELGGVETHIGDLVLTGAITTSMWGDKNLFFRHQDMADDVALKPEWEEYLDKFGIEHESGCPMMNMMKNAQRKGRVGDNL